jgi:hypothetical protein
MIRGAVGRESRAHQIPRPVLGRNTPSFVPHTPVQFPTTG